MYCWAGCLQVPEVFVGGMCGAMLVFYFSGLCMTAVGVTAQEIVREVRRQFRESEGRIMSGEQRPDYQRCVSCCVCVCLRARARARLCVCVCVAAQCCTFPRDPVPSCC